MLKMSHAAMSGQISILELFQLMKNSKNVCLVYSFPLSAIEGSVSILAVGYGAISSDYVGAKRMFFAELPFFCWIVNLKQCIPSAQ